MELIKLNYNEHTKSYYKFHYNVNLKKTIGKRIPNSFQKWHINKIWNDYNAAVRADDDHRLFQFGFLKLNDIHL